MEVKWSCEKLHFMTLHNMPPTPLLGFATGNKRHRPVWFWVPIFIIIEGVVISKSVSNRVSITVSMHTHKLIRVLRLADKVSRGK